MKIYKSDLNELADLIYLMNKGNGFHDVEHQDTELLALVLTELSESIEADRKARRGWLIRNYKYMSDIKFIQVFEKYTKDSVNDELADTILRLLDLAGLRGIVLDIPFDDLPLILQSDSYATNVYYISKTISSLDNRVDGMLAKIVNKAIFEILSLCFAMGVDIWYFVDMKLRYNSLREFRHGKLY